MTNEDTPKISIVGSAHRTQYWMELYNSIGHNNTSFEIIFVGPNEPDFKLPDNFRFIKSLVKPTQCLEIAVRNTRADLIMQMADDVVFRTERPLDKLYDTYKSYNNDKLILSCRYMDCGRDVSHTQIYVSDNCKFPIIVPVSGLMSKKLYRDLGGIDRNFIVCYWDLDMAFRTYAIRGCVKLSDTYIDETRGPGGSWGVYGDRQYLDSIWHISKDDQEIIHFNRTKPIEPFSDDRILVETQGPKNKWI